IKRLCSSSVSEDLGCRRGEFSRKHYGSVELLISSDADGAIQRAGRFRVENGSSDENTHHIPGTWRRTDVHLENPEYHTRWYFKYFLGKVHQNYIGTDSEKNPFFLSVVLSDQNNQRVPQYRSVLWRKTGTLKICLSYCPTKTLSVKSILSAMNLDRFEKSPREILNPEIQKDLLVLEEQEGSVNFKFGVLYAKDGQLTDDEMFSNEAGSENFQKLLNLLGDTITLKSWIGYRGGLDTKNDTTGSHSVYTVYQGHEIMFHVSTMLPYSKENKQQVERKRHIGNDIVTIVFQEGEEFSPSFKPSMIRSHFTHIFALVRYNKQNDSYRFKIFSEESVPLFGPPLPSPPVFTDHQEFRDFLLVKLINGEKATLETPTFAQKRQRTLDMLIRSLYQDLMPDLHKNMLNRRSLSDVLPESPRSARKKEEARQAEFVRIGQALKLKTIVRGDAPTSLATTGLCRKEPWESQCFCNNFPHETITGDSWGQSLLVSSDAAVLLIDEGQPSIPVFDKSLQIKQIHVLENLDLLITRADKGKDARLYVFRLSAIRKGLEDKQAMKSKYDCRDNKLEKTKGCHLYAINTHHSSELRIVVAIRNKLLLITRKFHQLNSFIGLTMSPNATESPVEEFQYIREICLSDPPVVMTLVDGPTGENDNMICVSYRHQFDLVNESTGESCRLHHVDTSRSDLENKNTGESYHLHHVDACKERSHTWSGLENKSTGESYCLHHVDVGKVRSHTWSDLVNNNTGESYRLHHVDANICYYKKVSPFNGGSPRIPSSASDFHFSWNQVPNAVVCAFPYILAFTTDSIEIRLVVNGNLVHTAVVPELQLVASRSDIYFKATSAVGSSSNSSSKDTSSHSSPQTPPGFDLPVFPSAPGEGELQYKNIYKIPLSNLVGRSIERPLKSPLVPKVITTPTSSGIACIPVTHSLSLSQMEIKEIACRTRKELLGLSSEPTTKSDSSHKQKKLAKKTEEGDTKQDVVRSSSTDRINSSSFESNSEGQRHYSTSSDPDTVSVEESLPFNSTPFQMGISFDEDIVDLK
ncbi:GTPase-activating Rap/Ran-GAP domain-like protein 3, partial [Bombina bombina]|uniref:GTPase-activating Rap/Ran-GAP domain-like protein 3 n=1 Tax=Bombina bombina TaxID=8345 RepID=UPI00235A8629